MLKFILTLLVFPLSLYAQNPFCVAHRSNGFGGLENSLDAFKKAVSYGAEAVEFDILHTKDKVPVIYHDKKLKRLLKGERCSLGEDLKDVDFQQIRSNCKLENGEDIPSLSEALEVLINIEGKVFIEIKDYITINDLETIKNSFAEQKEKIVFLSFHTEALDLIKKHSEYDEYYATVPLIHLYKYGFLPHKQLQKYDGLDTKYIGAGKIEKLKSQGKIVGVYTKNSKSLINLYIKRKVDFITTDNPVLCEELTQ